MDMSEANAIKFSGIVYKLQTLIDGGIRLTIDMPETCIPEMAMLAECKREGIPLVFEAKADLDSFTKLDNATTKRAEKPITRVGRSRS